MIKKIFFLLILNSLTIQSFAGGGGIDVSGGGLEIFLKIPKELYSQDLNWCLENHSFIIQDPEYETTLLSLPLTEREIIDEEWVWSLPHCTSF